MTGLGDLAYYHHVIVAIPCYNLLSFSLPSRTHRKRPTLLQTGERSHKGFSHVKKSQNKASITFTSSISNAGTVAPCLLPRTDH